MRTARALIRKNKHHVTMAVWVLEGWLYEVLTCNYELLGVEAFTEKSRKKLKFFKKKESFYKKKVKNV